MAYYLPFQPSAATSQKCKAPPYNLLEFRWKKDTRAVRTWQCPCLLFSRWWKQGSRARWTPKRALSSWPNNRMKQPTQQLIKSNNFWHVASLPSDFIILSIKSKFFSLMRQWKCRRAACVFSNLPHYQSPINIARETSFGGSKTLSGSWLLTKSSS